MYLGNAIGSFNISPERGLEMKKKRLFVLVIFLVILGLLIYYNFSGLSSAKESKIISETFPLADTCKSMQSDPITIKGKVLVCSAESKRRSDIHSMVSSSLKATDEDNQVTVFFIWPPRDVQVGYYSVSRQPGYVRYVDVAVIYWPDNKAAGFYSLVSEQPVQRRRLSSHPEFGDYRKPIAEWIGKLTRTNSL